MITSPGWRQEPLGEIAEVKWGDTSKTKAAYTQGGYLAYSASGPDGFLPSYDHEGPGIVLSAIGAQCGKTWFASQHWSCIKNTIFIKSARPDVDTRFLYYALHPPESWLRRGAAQPFISQGDARSRKVLVPPLKIQHRVVDSLSAYDDLIANNTRRVEILEEVARSLYREWFVSFRFPGHELVEFVESESGPIPSGWTPSTLGEVTINLDRLRKPLSKMQRDEMEGSYPYYGAAKVIDYVDDYIFDGTFLLVAEDGSVIHEDGTPVLQWVSEKFWANNHTHILQGTQEVSTEFLYLHLRDVNVTGYITGAAQPKITQANLNRIPVLTPQKNILRRFQQLIDPIFRQIEVLRRADGILVATRDVLLPKLVSGEIEFDVGSSRDGL